MEKREVLLDTNILLVPFRFRVDIFGGIGGLIDGAWEPVVSSGIVKELRGLATGGGKHSIEARLALAMLRERDVRVVRSDMPADEWLVERASGTGAAVATNDAKLARALKKAGCMVISLRTRSRLGVV